MSKTSCPGPKGDEYCMKNGGGKCKINQPGCPKVCEGSDYPCSCISSQEGCTGTKGDSYCMKNGGGKCKYWQQPPVCENSDFSCGPCDNAYPGYPCTPDRPPGI